MLYTELFKRNTPSGVADYSSEFEYIKSLTPVLLSRDENAFEDAVKNFAGVQIYDYEAFYSNPILGVTLPDGVDIILSTPESFVAHIYLKVKGTLIIVNHLYDDWVSIESTGIYRIKNPILRCFNGLQSILRQFESCRDCLEIACILSDEANVVGAPVLTTRVKIGTYSQLRGGLSGYKSNRLIKHEDLVARNTQLRKYFEVKTHSSLHKEGPGNTYNICKRCGAPLLSDGTCLFCMSSEND